MLGSSVHVHITSFLSAVNMHYNRFNFISHSVVFIAIFCLCISGFRSFSWHHSFLWVGIMWPCTLTQKMADGFLEVFQYSPSGHSSSTLFDYSRFGHYRNNTMQLLTICWSWNSRNGCLYVHEASAHGPGSTCGTGSWVLWCMYEMDVVFNQQHMNFFLHITAKRLY